MIRSGIIIIFFFTAYILSWPGLSAASDLNAAQGEEDYNCSEFSSLGEELSEGFDYSLRLQASGTRMGVADSTQNPNNNFFNLPQDSAMLDLRPDFRFNFRRLETSLKPRMNLEWQRWDQGSRKGDDTWEDTWFINEWLVRIRVIESLFVSYGRENLQWGPSFLFSPSNPFFLENGRSNPNLEMPGMDFGRLVWLPGEEWTVSFIANLYQGRQEFMLEDFKETYALKLDYTGRAGYAGIIVSHQPKGRNRLGAFCGWTATEALLIYGEGAMAGGSRVLYPVEDGPNPFGGDMQAIYYNSSSIKQIALAGISYTFETGPIFTLEYLYNGPGYRNEQAAVYYRIRRSASEAYAVPGPPGPLQRLAAMTLGQATVSGMQFIRQNYLMIQYVETGIRDVFDSTLRWTWNMDDNSGQFLAIFSYSIGDHVQLFSVGAGNYGSRDTEFRTVFEHSLMIGIEYMF